MVGLPTLGLKASSQINNYQQVTLGQVVMSLEPQFPHSYENEIVNVGEINV